MDLKSVINSFYERGSTGRDCYIAGRLYYLPYYQACCIDSGYHRTIIVRNTKLECVAQVGCCGEESPVEPRSDHHFCETER